MTEFLSIILIILVIIVFILYVKERHARSYFQSMFQDLRAEFNTRVADEAKKMFDTWREKEFTVLREHMQKDFEQRLEQLKEQVRKEYEVRYQQWIQEKEKEIREDAIKRSISTLLGRIGEHIAPLIIAQKLGINPKDLRFLGTPIDYIAFKGLSDGKPEEIVFIEVKSGKTPSLSNRERAVKKLVEARRVRWIMFSLTREVEELRPILEEEIKNLVEQQVKKDSQENS